MPAKLNQKDLHCRTLQDHVQKCQLLFNQHLTKGTRMEWSKRWGISRQSELLSLDNFDICTNMLHDPMHILLEGIVPCEIALFLFYCIEMKHFFTLEWLNSQLQTYPYSYLEKKDKPELIIKSHYYNDSKIKQTSASTLLLCSVLPYILSLRVPQDDGKFMNLVLLFAITHLCTSPLASSDTVCELRYLIQEHHLKFRQEYTKASFTPKMHYLLHLPDQIMNFGPARFHWCMRMEAKHAQFTSFKWKNFKNLPKSLILKHQKWLCLQLMSPTGLPSENYLYEGDTISGGSEKKMDDLPKEHMTLILEKIPHVTSIYHAQRVSIRGSIYEQGCVVILGYDEDHFPKFGWLQDLYISEHKKWFFLKSVTINSVIKIVNGYGINIEDEMSLLAYEDIFMKMPLSVHFFDGQPTVCNKYSYHSVWL
jgi:hypothetical protein